MMMVTMTTVVASSEVELWLLLLLCLISKDSAKKKYCSLRARLTDCHGIQPGFNGVKITLATLHNNNSRRTTSELYWYWQHLLLIENEFEYESKFSRWRIPFI